LEVRDSGFSVIKRVARWRRDTANWRNSSCRNIRNSPILPPSLASEGINDKIPLHLLYRFFVDVCEKIRENDWQSEKLKTGE